LAKQRAQRDKYYKHRNKESTPEGRSKYLSIIIDRMDKKKTKDGHQHNPPWCNELLE